MPTPEQILAGLQGIANAWQSLAIAWHVYFALIAVGLIMGWRPSQRIGAILLALPLLSVSVLAWLFGNPFNGTLFALAGITLLAIALGSPPTRIQLAPLWGIISGLVMFAFGWVYPHFLDTSSYFAYLIAAPTGLIPCPTLSIVTGLALVTGGLGSRSWSLVLGALGAFYGTFGAARLGVTIDWALVVGAVILVGVALIPDLRQHRLA